MFLGGRRARTVNWGVCHSIAALFAHHQAGGSIKAEDMEGHLALRLRRRIFGIVQGHPCESGLIRMPPGAPISSGGILLFPMLFH